MTCKNCGNEIQNGTAFCTECGTAVEVTPVEAPVATEAVYQENVEQQAPVYEQMPVQEEAPKKKGKGKKILLIVLIVLAVLGVVGFIFKDFFISTFMHIMPAEKQMQYAYGKTIKNFTSDVADVYSEGMDVYEKGTASKGTIELEVSDELLALLGATGVDSVEKVAIDYNVIIESMTKMGYEMNLKYGDKQIAEANLYLDMAENAMVVEVPTLTDKAVKIDMNELTGDSDYSSYTPDMTAVYENIEKILPSKELIKNLIPAVIEAAFKQINNVSSEKVAFTAGGVTQKETRFKAVITQQTIANMGKAVIDEIKSSKDVKDYTYKLAEFVNEMNSAMGDESENMTPDQFYSQFVMALDSAKAELNEMTRTEELMTLYTWADSRYNIIAIQVEAPEEAGKIFVGKAKDGNKVGYEVNVADMFVVTGSGTEKNDKLTATFNVQAEGQDVVTFEVADWCVTKDNVINGTIKVVLDEEMLSLISEEAATLGNIGISFTMEGNKKSAKNTLAIELNGTQVVSLSATGEITNDEPVVKIPENATTDVEDWTASFDQTKVMQIIEDLGLSDLLGMLMMGGADSVAMMPAA